MAYVDVPVTCNNCNAKLIVRMQPNPGIGVGGHAATCPKCNKTFGSFPNKIVDAFENEATSA